LEESRYEFERIEVTSWVNSGCKVVDGSGAVMAAEAEAEEVGPCGGGRPPFLFLVFSSSFFEFIGIFLSFC
jgi:hypothetical protein